MRFGFAATLRKNLKKELRLYELWLFLLPALIIIIVYRYVPMYGAQIAFRNFRASIGIWNSPWVGLDNFSRFFRSAQCWTVIKNTLVLSLYSLLAGTPLAIILALMVHSLRSKRLKKVAQTITYAPYFISNVVMCGMILIFCSPYSGLIPHLMEAFTGAESSVLMGSPKLFPHIYVISGIWQMTGWNSIIYIASLSGVSAELYEAAKVDGANKLQCITHINLPSILPTVITVLIINCGRIMTLGFEKAFLLQNNMNIDASEILSTYVYKIGLIGGQFSYAASIDLFNSIVNLIIILAVNWAAKRFSETSIW